MKQIQKSSFVSYVLSGQVWWCIIKWFLNDLPDNVICDIAIYAGDTTLYSKCDWASDLWQQLELASELESDIRDIVDWGKKWLVDFSAGKTQLVLFDQSNNNSSIDVKMDGSVLDEKSSFNKMLGLTFSSNTLGAQLVLYALQCRQVLTSDPHSPSPWDSEKLTLPFSDMVVFLLPLCPKFAE